MPELENTPTYQLSASEKAEIVGQLINQIAAGGLTIPISDADKTDIIQEVSAELYAGSQDTSTLTKVSSLDGITSLPAVKDDSDIVAVPLGLLTTNAPQEVSGQDAIDVLVAQGKIVPTQIYFTQVDDE